MQRKTTSERIERVNQLLDKYRVMSIRQIYYQFIARGWEPKEWKDGDFYFLSQ